MNKVEARMDDDQKNKKHAERRSFLKRSAAAALGVTALNGAAFAQDQRDFDVIVIGAGIAGLTAAKLLVGWGYGVAILEATDKVGGRILTDHSLGAAFDLGAGWIHGPRGNPISKLAENVSAKTFLTSDNSFRVFDAQCSVVPKAKILKKQDEFEALLAKVDATFDPDLPLSKAIEKVAPETKSDPILKWMLSAYTEFDTGGPLDQLSAYYFDEDEAYPGNDVIFSQGYDQILSPLAKGLDIRLNHPVDRIEYEKGEGAYLYVGNERFESSFVICTAPLGVLQKGSIAFEPKLPRAVTKSISNIGMGNVTKLALKFDEAFWPTDVQYFGLMTKEQGRWNYFLNYRTFSDQNILVGLSFGHYAKKIEQLNDQEMVDDCVAAIRSMFGNNAPAPAAFMPTRWSKNPYSKGAYSYSKTGVKPCDFDELATPIEDVILLAGEHTTFKHHATTHGAYLSGIRAAQLIEEELA
jgi:monoamine oxidase